MSEVLALKYRPQTFEEVIGQDQTISQLKSALENGTLGHALILCGTRGSGKTTTARLIAKALNPELSAPELAMVVAEVDAASNTGVDNVREIIESIRYSARGRRVVVLDEAHMLSKNACNALLKTLEEPPPGVTFILLTTEPHKLIPTVKSRCQIYEFHDVGLATLTKYYLSIAQKEGLDLSEGAIEKIALGADGSVRDGLTALQKYLSGEEVADNADTYFDLVKAIYSGDTTTALALVSKLRKMEESRVIIQTLEKWFYWASLEFFGGRTPVREHFERGGVFADQFSLTKLQDLFGTCLSIERDFTATPNSRVALEMGVIKLCLESR
jgi:DNA polymerase-3 subunit gamma/tau